MKNRFMAITLSIMITMSATGCAGKNNDISDTPNMNIAYEDMIVGETATDIKADLKILTNRTDLIDTDFSDYIDEFTSMYPNVTIKYEGITNYESDVTTRLTTGNWGDICCIPATVPLSDLEKYFESFGDYSYFQNVYELSDNKMYNNKVYGLPTMGSVSGIVYNTAVFEEAGVTELPASPDEFLDSLQKIADNTDAIPMYTNYAASWTLTAWDSYITGSTGDPDYKHNSLVHSANPFSRQDDLIGPYAIYYTLYEAVHRGLTEEDPTTTDWEGSKVQINAGNIGCMVLGSWSVPQIKKAGENGDDIAYMPFPISVGGHKYASAIADYCYGVNVNSSADNKTAAMLYIKYLTESSGYALAQGGIPIVKGDEYPDFLQDFKNVTLVSDNPAPEGEEQYFEDINNMSEISLDADPTHVAEIIEAAIDDTKTFDEIMDKWNEAWSKAQQSAGVTTN